MRKSILTLSMAAALAAPALAAAQATPASPITGNMTLASDYRFRGISQTFGEPTLQGGFDYAHASGVYLGNWNSNVSETAGFPNGNLEMDFYGGWKKTFGDFGLDVGAIYYYYPGSEAAGNGRYVVINPNTGSAGSGKVTNLEFYVGGSWKFLSAKYFHAVDDYFSVPGSKNSSYVDLTATWDLGNGWGVNGHVGTLKVKGVGQADYTDYKLGVTKDIGGWVFGAAFISTDAKDGGSCAGGTGQFYHFCKFDSSGAASKDYDGGKSTIVFSVAKTF